MWTVTKKRLGLCGLLGSFGRGHRIIPMSPTNLFRKRGERGYVLLVFLLTVSVLSVGLLAMVESVDFQIKRDQEEEFIHRGVEYSRAVRRYVKKFGHYPPSIDALENSGNLRFLRRRYKDPLTKKDFKVLHYGDIPGLNPGNLAGGNPSIPAANSQVGAAQIGNGQPAVLPNSATESAAPNPNGTAQPSQGASQGETATPQTPEEVEAAAAEATNAEAAATQAAADEKLAGTPVIVGVTSYSNRETIRVFNKKNHYNQWQFIYDPSTDRGLMKGPNQPLPLGARQAPPVQGAAPAADAAGSAGQK
jgi:hypothetical protein